ncbi:MAG: alkaline phosphatase family protein [Hyphomicrobiaceae bacterium]
MRHALLAAALAAAAPFAASTQATAQAVPGKPDLVVTLAIDQFGQLLFDKWRGAYKSGLKRLADEGIIYDNAYQSHGITETCAGHSTLLTGKHPGHTGIVANEWYDAAAGKQVYCVADDGFTQAHDAKARKVGPKLLVATTLGDWIKAQQPASRVVVVSGKDRASLTMAGHHADAVFWYADAAGFTTLIAHGEDAQAKLAPVAKVNAKAHAMAAAIPPWTYTEETCRALEDSYQLGKVVWHSKLPPEMPSEDGKAPGKVRPLHIMDPLTVDAARELSDYYQLGRRGVTDLLAVSLSATDFIGHGYGTQGPEMCDHIRRLDAGVGDFLTYLDGLGLNILLVVTGDHGGSDFAERLARQGFESARRISPKALLADINAGLKQALSLDYDTLVSPDSVQVYAVGKDGKALDESERTKVVEAALAAFRQRPEIEQAYGLTDLLNHKVTESAASDYSLEDRFSQSVMRGRSGDIILAYKSGISVSPVRPTRFIMGHAGPYRHDTAVPIIFWWKGVKPQVRPLPADTTSIAPTLANIMGVTAPADLDGPCLDIGYPGARPCRQ